MDNGHIKVTIQNEVFRWGFQFMLMSYNTLK